MGALRWWEVWGAYASALVAAETEEEAVEIANRGGTRIEWSIAEPAERPVPPADPPAAGLYAWFAE